MTAPPARKRLILVNGTMGVGKTTTCLALMDRLQPAAFLDGDWCWTMKPWTVNDRSIAMVERNIAFVLRGYLANPDIGTVIFGWVMHRAEIVRRLIASVEPQDAELHVVSLVCSPEALAARIRADAARSPGALAGSLDRLPMYRDMPWPKIDVSAIGADEAADRIAAMAGA